MLPRSRDRAFFMTLQYRQAHRQHHTAMTNSKNYRISIILIFFVCTNYLPASTSLATSSVSVPQNTRRRRANINNGNNPQERATCFVIAESAEETTDHLANETYIDELIESFSVERASVEMLNRCWDGFDVQIAPPSDNFFRVNQYYNFSISVSVRQSGPYSTTNNSSEGPDSFPGLITPQNYAFVRLILCDIRKYGFCTPYTTTTEAKTIHATHVEEYLTAQNGPTQGHAAFNLPTPASNTDEFHTATPYHRIALQPTINVTVDADGSTTVLSSDNELVAGTDSYLDQAANLIVSLNVSSREDREPRSFLLLGEYRRV